MSDEMTATGSKKLYEDFAGPYAAVSDDRDFNAEVKAILQVCGLDRGDGKGLRVLELFAGPAEHSRAFAALGHLTTAVDAASAMRDVAVARDAIDPNNYFVTSVPDLDEIPSGPYDIITIMRYSVGYLDRSAVVSLLRWCYSHLTERGAVVFEIHKLDWLRNDLSEMGIRDRSAKADDSAEVQVIWPSGPLAWSPTDWKVSMPLEIWCGGELAASLVSVENIYSGGELENIGDMLGGFESLMIPEDIISQFSQSTLVVLRRI